MIPAMQWSNMVNIWAHEDDMLPSFFWCLITYIFWKFQSFTSGIFIQKQEKQGHLFAESHEEIVWFHVAVDKVLPVDELNSTYLVNNLEKHC